MDNWDDLRHFLAVSRSGSLKAAARSMGIDQSTVFRRLRALENCLGAQLFDRRQHGKYILTVAGESLLTQATQIEAATFNIDREVQGQDLELSGTIKLTTSEDIAVVLLPRHLIAFQQRYPTISVEILTANRYFSLGRGEADVAIRPSASSNEDRVVPRRVCRTYLSLFASPDYLEKYGEPKNRDDLADHRLVRWKGELTEGGFDSVLRDHEEQDGVNGSNSLMAQCAMAEAGMGIAYLPDFVGQASHKLVPVLALNRIDSGFIWILHHDDLRRVARVRAFVDFMVESLRQDPHLNVDQGST